MFQSVRIDKSLGSVLTIIQGRGICSKSNVSKRCATTSVLSAFWFLELWRILVLRATYSVTRFLVLNAF